MWWRRALAACAVAGLAFALYHATLLPGFDFGDTGSFQTMVGSPIITTRDGYPLYFALGAAFLRVTGGDPAHSLNLLSAIGGAAACGLLALSAGELSGSILAGIGSALLFAGSYTFWSQSIIAEVYTLHILFVALTLWLLLRWEERPTVARLGAFFGIYALGFGNHLSMILLAPAYTLFLLVSRGWRSLLSPSVLVLALGAATAGAMQYAWNVRTLWFSPIPPHGLLDGLRTAWFDITKSDWRASMMMQVPSGMTRDHLSMYLFDVRQQFGWIGLPLAALGLAGLAVTRWRWAMLIGISYVVNAAFAYSYNVGDAHVFYLPSHVMLALLGAPGIVFMAKAAGRLSRRSQSIVPIAALVLIAYAAIRIYQDYPALDRSHDLRPTEILRALTADLDDRHAILLTDLNWQVENGLSYFAKIERPEVAHAGMPDLLNHAPALIRDNFEIGRQVAMTARARAELTSAYGSLIPTIADTRVVAPGMSDMTHGLAPGTRYVLTVLKPSRDFHLDIEDLSRAVGILSDGQLGAIPDGDYALMAGVAGQRPALVIGSNEPFRRRVGLDGVAVEIRMDSWLAADTIRRMGFGHVIVARRHTLIVERGVSFVAFDGEGRPIRSGYAASIFAPQPRYLCYR